MCQLNVYCLSEKISKEKTRKIFNRSFGANPETVCVDDKFNMKENSTRFCYYVNGWCNCDSVISCCQEYDGKLSFDEYYTQLCKKEVKRLSEIQHFMQREEYSKEKTVFDEKIQKISEGNIDIYGFGFNNFYRQNSNIEEIQIENPNKINILLIRLLKF